MPAMTAGIISVIFVPKLIFPRRGVGREEDPINRVRQRGITLIGRTVTATREDQTSGKIRWVFFISTTSHTLVSSAKTA